MKLKRCNFLTILTILFVILFVVSAPALLFSLAHEVIYVEGLPYVRDASGDERDIDTGDVVQPGDTVITEAGDFVELEAAGYTVKISENTVFSIREIEEGGQKTDVLSIALGKLSFSRDKFFGNEPYLATSSAICGVRGTNFAMLAGVDGSSLIIVEEGSVEVIAAGKIVAVSKDEGVEVLAGSAPGNKFRTLEREIDFSKWNQGRLDTFLKDPVASAENVKTQMEVFIAEIKTIYPIYREKKIKLREERQKVRNLIQNKSKKEGEKYYKENVFPLEIDATYHYLNIRYYALSALSLRRFVSGRMYAIIKARSIMSLGNPIYIRFLEIHRSILDIFEEEVVENFIVQADI